MIEIITATLCVIAGFQFLIACFSADGRTMIAFGLKAVIFGLFGIDVIVGMIIDVPEIAHIVVDWVIIGCLLVFVITNQARVTMDGINNDRHSNGKQ